MLMFRRFGVEIEAYNVSNSALATALTGAGLIARTAGYGGSATTHWRVGTDASIRAVHGFELVSPVLSGEEGLDALVLASRVAVRCGAKVNRSCGLHVHIEVRDFDLKAFKRLVKSYANNEDVFDALMPLSRRDSANQYTRSTIGLYEGMTNAQRIAAVQSVFQQVDAATSLDEIVRVFGDRYRKLNLLAYLEHGTVEFRHHAGTVSGDKIANWVRFCQAFVEHAHKARSIRAWGDNKMTKTERLRTVLRMTNAMDLYPFYRDRIRELRNDNS